MKAKELCPELKEFSELLKKNGFKVYKNVTSSTYIFFEENNNIGYCEYNNSGLNFSSVHKANRTSGTGFCIHQEMYRPTVTMARDCFVIAPHWASAKDRESVRKYKNFWDYIKAIGILVYEEV